MQIKKFIDELSDEQKSAAVLTDKPVLALAGAGSGKTRMLMGRFAHLVAPETMGGLGADPSSVMMVTFTNKAAREMRERIDPIMEELRETSDRPVRDPWIGTFHGLSLRILRIEADKAGLGKNFSIFDESDSRSLVGDVVEELGVEVFDVDDFFSDLEKAKARMLSPGFLINGQKKMQDPSSGAEEQRRWKIILDNFTSANFLPVYEKYQNALQEQNAVDFNDLLNRTTRLFQENEDVRNAWRSSFRHFMVDEVQDINRAQVSWLQALTNGGKELEISPDAIGSEYGDATDGLHEVNTYRLRRFPRPTIAFVGDDDQSIYAFRGSEVAVMRGLDKRFRGLEKRFLKTSYRCQPSILSTANSLVGVNAQRFGKDLQPHDSAERRGPVRIVGCATPEAELARITREAEAYLADGGNPSEFAVLTRTRDLVKAVAKALRATGLPVVEGKSSDIRKTAEVKDVMGFVTYLTNKDAEVPLRRIINKPSRGLGPTSLRRVTQNAKLKSISFLDELKTVMNDRIEVPEGGEPYKAAFVTSVKNFSYLVDQMSSRVAAAPDAGAALMVVLRDSGYLEDLYRNALKSAGLSDKHTDFVTLEPKDFLKKMLRSNRDANEKTRNQDSLLEGEDLVDRAGQLSETARRIGNLALLIEEAKPFPSLEAFAQESVLEMSQAQAPSGIQVMTVHASKGLEFDHVRLPFWTEGVMPHGRAVTSGSDEGIEEERRLAYVAITRARQTVEVSKPFNVRGCSFIRQDRATDSRFIDEMKAAGYQNCRFLKKSDTSFAYEAAPITKIEPQKEVKPAVREDFKMDESQNKKKSVTSEKTGMHSDVMGRPEISYEKRFAEMPDYSSDFGDFIPAHVDPNEKNLVDMDRPEVSYEKRFAEMPDYSSEFGDFIPEHADRNERVDANLTDEESISEFSQSYDTEQEEFDIPF